MIVCLKDNHFQLIYSDTIQPVWCYYDGRNVFQEYDSVEECIGGADVIYMEPVVQPDYTLSRDEVPEDYGLTPKEYKVTKKLLLEKAQIDAIVLHSLPRMDELPVDVDETRISQYWEEAFNGVVMRMALLSLVLCAME